ncbi:MAG: MFS transporter [Halobacteriota archaeon]
MTVWADPYRRRWLLWGVLGCTFLLVNIYRLSTAVIATDLMAAFDTTGAQLGTLHAMFFYVYAVMQIPTGILVDRIGPRRTATVGAITMNAGAIWFGLAGGYAAALGARFLIGLGGSVIFVSLLRFSANWFSASEFSTMNGLSFAVGGVGGILATTPFAIVVDGVGWEPTFLLLGAVGLGLAVVTFVLVRDSAERAGLEPIENVPETAMLSIAEVRAHTRTVVRDRWTWIVGLLLFCTSGLNLTLFGLWGIPYVVQTYDTSVTIASTVTLAAGIGGVVGPPTIGWLSARTDRRVELILVGTILYTLSLGVIAVTGKPPFLVVAGVFFLVGALFGAFVLTYPMITERHASRASGIAMGSINGAAFLGAAMLPTLMGWALDTYWTGEYLGGVRVYTATGYRVAFAIATAAGAVAICCAIWVLLTDRRTR